MPRLPESPRVVITGAASGFGRALAVYLAQERRARLVLGDIDEAGLAETAKQVEQHGGQARTLRCDVREIAEIEALAALADEAFRGVDLVVNNAGVAAVGPVGEVSLENWRWQVDINLWGVIYGCHVFVPKLRAQGSGFVLNVASSAGLLAAPLMAPYNVTKAGVVALSETLFGELAGSGVSVTALCPTFFRTNIHENSRTTGELREQTAKLVTNAKWSAEAVAAVAVAGLEAGELYVIPQADGKVMWRTKRLLGQRFHGAAGKVARNPKLMRWLMSR
uniref:Short-chain dehydrogenase/reductase SDR n=1 Tax=Pseudenhygromyxa salsuginis TaxID=442868 RepID=A0A3S7UWS9_9BACT|nr:short-chain dehydrogenase/reductase SDR [Pseudenhygromyxa salsuginis]